GYTGSDVADDNRGKRYFAFCGKEVYREFQKITGAKFRFTDGIPQRSPKQGSLENSGDSAQLLHDGFAAAIVEKDAAVSIVPIVEEYILRTGFRDGYLEFGPPLIQFRAQPNCVPV